MPGYAVIDLETTGFYAGGSDRVVEIAVVQLDPCGRRQSNWTTLVNPGRDLGPTHVHRIRAADARQAPQFGQLAGDLIGQLAGRVIVAHNAAFDLRFLSAEFDRAGVAIPDLGALGLCTMEISGQYLPVTKRTLASCCAAAAISLHEAHTASADAEATAELLRYYLAAHRLPADPHRAWRASLPWSGQCRRADDARWPALPGGHVRLAHRRDSARPQPLMKQIAQGVTEGSAQPTGPDAPTAPGPRAAGTYLRALNAALMDGVLSGRERDQLVRIATQGALDPATVAGLHRDYLAGLVQAAPAAAVADLVQIARQLDLPADLVDQLRRQSPPQPSMPQADASDQLVGIGVAPTRPARLPRLADLLTPGAIVVFTGAMAQPREEWTARALAAGLRVGSAVTKKTAVLVAADPDSLSTKARKAEQYRIPIVTESAFAATIEVRRGPES